MNSCRRPTVDEADATAERAEKEAPYLIAASRRPTGPVANGRCHYCDDIVPDEARWCNHECRSAWERETFQRKQAGVKK